MILIRPALLIVAVVCLALPPSLRAQTPPAWAPDKQFSADEVVTLKDGMILNAKLYLDNGKIRSEGNMGGMNMVSIVRPDEKKMYMLMPSQKMAMEMPLSPDKIKQFSMLTAGTGTKFDLVGPDVAGGLPCIKYKMTTVADNKVYDWWVNAATRTPVKFASEDGSVNVAFSNYKTGPQDAALFQPPTDDQVMQMPAGMGGGGMPGSAPSGPPGQ
jgi:hypothetical protein